MNNNYELTQLLAKYVKLKNPLCASRQEYNAVRRLLEDMLGIEHGWESKERDKQVFHFANNYRSNSLPQNERARDLALLVRVKIVSGISLPEEIGSGEKKKKRVVKESSKKKRQSIQKSHEILAFKSMMKIKPGDDAA